MPGAEESARLRGPGSAAVAWAQATLPDARILYQDPTWAFVEAGGVKLAFIQQGHHPDHLGWRVSEAELERLAAEKGQTIRTHRDRTRSIYLGFLVHITVAFSMDFLALLRRGALPTVFWPPG